jgi:kumamolisin
MASSPPPPVGLAAIEAAYQTLGQLISVFRPMGGQTGMSPPLQGARMQASIIPTRTGQRCRNYIKYPAPPGLRPRVGTPYRVADLCKAYNFPINQPGGGVIGILELGGGYTQTDLDLFSQINGLPQIQVSDVPINGGQNTPGQQADGEVLLDIQVAAAAYYFATGQMPTIKMFFAPNSMSSFPAVMNAAATAGCDVLSISWGADESAWGADIADQTEAAAQQLTESGCVILAASGDNASSDGDVGANVDLPSACPHVIGCGGTTKTPFSEVVWGDGTPNGYGTGGGYSTLFSPPEFQIGAPPSPGHPGRMVPDVAANADPNTGYLIVVNGQEIPIGGTSAVAPFFAGLFAAFGRQLGFVTPTLWQNPEAFEDITQGSNGSFSASIGPDPCTGLGVPIGQALASLFSRTGGRMAGADERIGRTTQHRQRAARAARV